MWFFFRLPNEDILPQYKEDDYKYILLWNTFFEDDAFEFRWLKIIYKDRRNKSYCLRGWVGENWESRETFSALKCPESKCLITNKRKFLHDVTSFDALVFHERNLRPKDLPESRHHSQLYVHYNLEAPFWSLIIGKCKSNNWPLTPFNNNILFFQETINSPTISTSACPTEMMQIFH